MRETILTVGEGLYELGLDDLGGALREGFGGDAANAAVMASRMGARTQFVGRIGDDAVGRRLFAFWQSNGVGVEHVILDSSHPTGIYVNRRGADGHHRFDYHRTGSAGSGLTDADIVRVPLDEVSCVHFTGIGVAVSPTSAHACSALVKRARSAGARISFALNVRPRLAPSLTVVRDAAAAADVVFASSEDAALVYGDVDAAVDALARSVQELIVTDGSDGATVYFKNGSVQHAAPAVDVLDAAGAGDALAGAYLAARVRGDDEGVALLEGVVAGALSCAAFGCAASYPSLADVRAGCAMTGGRNR